MKEVYMIGGPNGAGKTTAAKTLLKPLHIDEFLNADNIASGLAPLHADSMAIAAARLMIQRLDQLIAEGKNFAFETTCSGRNYMRILEQCQKQGYQTHLIFLWLPKVDMAISRVRMRVMQGGHSIPEPVIRRRYASGIKNMLTFYIHMCDNVVIYDSSSPEYLFDGTKKVAEKIRGGILNIHNPQEWQHIQESI